MNIKSKVANARKGLPRADPNEVQLADENVPVWERIRSVMGSDPLVNTVVILAITVGFFHGWLKSNYHSPIITLLFDILLLISLLLVLLQEKYRSKLFPPGPIASVLLAFYAVCFAYLFFPTDHPPLIIGVAALRGWCFATLMYSLGYKLTRSLNQVKAYFYVLIILGVLTSIYGIRQNPTEIMARMKEDADYAQRFNGTWTVGRAGDSQLRHFSTFVSAGAFGGTLANVILFTLILIGDRKTSRNERWILVAAILPMGWGLLLSGARASWILFSASILVIAWVQKKIKPMITIVIIGLVAYKVSTLSGTHLVEDRFSTLKDSDTVISRFAIPVETAFNLLKGAPLGHGLGKSSYSVPFFLMQKINYEFVGAEGDLGAVAADMGIFGLICFCRIMYVISKCSWDYMNSLRDTPLAAVAMAAGTCVLFAVVSFPIGSPFLGIPMGALTWFFLGTLQKLQSGYASGIIEGAVDQNPSEPQPVGKRFLYRRTPGAKMAPPKHAKPS
jgi:hypothetical protein